MGNVVELNIEDINTVDIGKPNVSLNMETGKMEEDKSVVQFTRFIRMSDDQFKIQYSIPGQDVTICPDCGRILETEGEFCGCDPQIVSEDYTCNELEEALNSKNHKVCINEKAIVDTF